MIVWNNTEERETSFWQKNLSFVDKVIYSMRLSRIFSGADFSNKIVADTGSWYNFLFLRAIADRIQKWYAVDRVLNIKNHPDTIETIESDLNEGISLESDSLDIVTSMAILEHLHTPEQYLKEIYRILKPQGTLIMTVPSVYAKPVLEFLAYRLGVISEVEIRDHKEYYDRSKLKDILKRAGFSEENIRHSYFQFGMNNFVVAVK
ncbi:MAG: hypothetical protein ACD_78C00197G0017 [uncultured bacterium (gcode 4)]|uniref:Uncharacterized protein n=1 Tax=uncultured bacterium (gcode 4) TaxID=1234023 RepID=K1XXQ2_9BACT|nr:MAG: hypothetical protein ACD_78C00197G0017 [uncultured bacterium (gcode 4)]